MCFLDSIVGFNSSLYGGDIRCAAGGTGQAACFSYKTDRVAVIQRSNSLWDGENIYAVMLGPRLAMNPEVLFDVPAESPGLPSPTNAPVADSSVSKLSASWSWIIAIGASLTGFCLY